MKGFVRGHEKIGECSLAMDHMPELKAIELEAVYPGRNLRDRRYRNHPAIKMFLDATSLESTVDGKPLRADYYVSREANKCANLERAGSCTPEFACWAIGTFQMSWRIEWNVKRHASRRHC